jgi:hypothetical protein
MAGPNFLAVTASGEGKLFPCVNNLVRFSKRGFVFGTVRFLTKCFATFLCSRLVVLSMPASACATVRVVALKESIIA